MKLFNTIDSAREGLHTTLYGEYVIEHRGERTFCTMVPVDTAPKWETESGRDAGFIVRFMHPDFEEETLQQRQERADMQHSPQRDKI